MISYRNLSDAALADLLRSGDRIAYTEMYNRYEAPVYTFTYKRIGEREEAKDIVQELFLGLWENHHQLHIKVGVLPYLYTSVKHKILDRVKHKKVSARYIDAFQHYLEQRDESTDHLLRHNELALLIEKEITMLPAKMKEVFELSRKTNYSRKEIAVKLNMPEETVKSHMHHALKLLKVKLGPLLILVFMIKP